MSTDSQRRVVERRRFERRRSEHPRGRRSTIRSVPAPEDTLEARHAAEIARLHALVEQERAARAEAQATAETMARLVAKEVAQTQAALREKQVFEQTAGLLSARADSVRYAVPARRASRWRRVRRAVRRAITR